MKSVFPSLQKILFAFIVSLILGITGYLLFPYLDTRNLEPAHLAAYLVMTGSFVGMLLIQIIDTKKSRSTEIISIFVGNLPFKANSNQLRKIFSAHGRVHNVRLMTDKVTRKPRGFGFIEMNRQEAQSAIRDLNGYELMGRELKVNFANERG